VRIDVSTGRREPWKSLAPSDLTGLVSVGPVLMTPDGRQYAYGYLRNPTSELYLVESLK
jgi:hypothetical protein